MKLDGINQLGGTMNHFFKSAFQLAATSALILSLTQTVLAAPAPATKDVAIGFNDVYVPGGFDPGADAYVIASGLFPNGCYSWKRADVNHIDTFTHEIQSFASVSQGMCIMVLVPFTKEIRLGKLSSGTHTLKFLSGDGTYLQKTMLIN